MLSDRLAAALARRNIHYGWVVAATTFLTMLVTAGAVGAPGVFILPLQREFGWQTSDISSALAVRLLLFGLMGPFAAALINRYGLRRIATIALSLIAGGLLLSLGMTHVWQLIVLWGLVLGFGTGMTALVLGATVATRWFTARRGLVVGLLTASSATGQLVFLPLLASLNDHVGWRVSILVVTGAMALAVMAITLLMRDRPSDVGLPPYGETTVIPPAAPSAAALSPIAALRDAARTRVFWILFATFFICGASTNGLIQTHFIPLCADFGLPAVGGDGHVRHRRHHRVGLALRPLRQPLASVLVLRLARALAHVSAVLGFHILWSITVRIVLWPRLDRDGAADCKAHGHALRPRARQPGVRVDFCRAPAGRGNGGVWSGRVSHRAPELSAGVLCRWRIMSDCGRAHPDARRSKRAETPRSGRRPRGRVNLNGQA